MPPQKTAVKFTANFESNLAAVEAFWMEAGAPQAYDQLLGELGDTVIPTLERFPEVGRRFLARPGYSVEVIERIGKLSRRRGADRLREYLCGDYLILYTAIGNTIYLLAIKHHKQLSFDFHALWGAAPEKHG